MPEEKVFLIDVWENIARGIWKGPDRKESADRNGPWGGERGRKRRGRVGGEPRECMGTKREHVVNMERLDRNM